MMTVVVPNPPNGTLKKVSNQPQIKELCTKTP